MTYLTTLRRIPADIRLAMATRDYDMDVGAHCLCGWAVKEALHKTLPEEVNGTYYSRLAEITGKSEIGTVAACCLLFGGTEDEWQRVFDGVVDHLPRVERAFAQALDEAYAETAP